MFEIQMVGENILAQKAEAKAKSEFENPGGGDRQGAIYRICHAPAVEPPETPYKSGDLVLLAPGEYSTLHFNDELYTRIEESDIIGKVKEVQDEQQN